jgi:hypothetical protein
MGRLGNSATEIERGAADVGTGMNVYSRNTGRNTMLAVRGTSRGCRFSQIQRVEMAFRCDKFAISSISASNNLPACQRVLGPSLAM